MTSTEPPAVNWPPFDPGGHRRSGKDKAIIGGLLAAAVAAAAVGVILLTGGDDEPAAAPPTAPPATTSSPTPSPVASTPPKPADIAAADAKAKYLEYLRVDDEVSNGGFKNLKPYDAVAISPERTELEVVARRSAGQYSTGSLKVYSLGVESVKLPTDPKLYPEVRLLACLDVTGTGYFDASGKSLVAADRPPRIKAQVLLQKIPASAFKDGTGRAGWFVADVKQPGEPC